MSKEASSNQTIVETRKKAILDAALELFARNGYGSTRIETVAKKAGLSYGLTYYYFSSKDVLFHMTVERAIDKSFSLIYSEANSPCSSYENLRNYTERFLNWAKTDEGAHSLLLFNDVLFNDRTPKITRAFVTDKMNQRDSNLLSMIEDIQKEGYVIKQSPKSVVALYNATIIGYAFLRISKRDASLPDVDTFLKILL